MVALLTLRDCPDICDIEFGIDDLMGLLEEGEIGEDGDETIMGADDGTGLAYPLAAMQINDNGFTPPAAPMQRSRSPIQPEPVSDDGF